MHYTVSAQEVARLTVHDLNRQFGHRLGSRELDVVKMHVERAVAAELAAQKKWLAGEHPVQIAERVR